MKRKQITCMLLLTFIAFIQFFACKSNEETIAEHDPNQPVRLTTFYPDSGGIGTKMILNGSNFGTDTSKIEVWFNEKKAVVVKSLGDQMYVLAPRLPGDTCVISVKVGKETGAYEQDFLYLTRFNVTTIAGQPGSGGFEEGTLASASLGAVNCIAIDKENNIFITTRFDGNVAGLVNESGNLATKLFNGAWTLNAPTVGDDQTIYFPGDPGDNYYECSPETMWIPKLRMIIHPSADSGLEDFSIDWKQSLAFSEFDGGIYTYAFNGQLVRFDPRTRVGQKVAQFDINADAFLCFDPVETHLLYMVCAHRNSIYLYNLITGEHSLFAGSGGAAGYRDGKLLDAEFNNPRQITIGPDGYFYIADAGNHCIRQITPDGNIITVVGVGEKAGYQDGDPDVALFNTPTGVALDQEGNIYVTDRENKCLRKLTME